MRADILERRCAEMRARFAHERAKRLADGLRPRGIRGVAAREEMRKFWDTVYADKLKAKKNH